MVMSPCCGGGGGGDGELQQFFLAVHAGCDGTAAGVCLDNGGGEALLHLLAHGGGLGEHVLHFGEVHGVVLLAAFGEGFVRSASSCQLPVLS